MVFKPLWSEILLFGMVFELKFSVLCYRRNYFSVHQEEQSGLKRC